PVSKRYHPFTQAAQQQMYSFHNHSRAVGKAKIVLCSPVFGKYFSKKYKYKRDGHHFYQQYQHAAHIAEWNKFSDQEIADNDDTNVDEDTRNQQRCEYFLWLFQDINN